MKFIHKLLSSFPGFSPTFMSIYIYFDFEYHRTAVSQVSKSHSCVLVKVDLFRCPAGDRKSPPLNIFGKEVDLARNPFHKQRIYHQKSINIQQSFRLGRRATLYRERLIKKEDFKRRYSRDRRRSFSISLVFIRQFWNRVCKRDHVRHKEIIIINRCAEIYSQRNSTGRAID